jgi:hypothetical protein
VALAHDAATAQASSAVINNSIRYQILPDGVMSTQPGGKAPDIASRFKPATVHNGVDLLRGLLPIGPGRVHSRGDALDLDSRYAGGHRSRYDLASDRGFAVLGSSATWLLAPSRRPLNSRRQHIRE